MMHINDENITLVFFMASLKLRQTEVTAKASSKRTHPDSSNMAQAPFPTMQLCSIDPPCLVDAHVLQTLPLSILTGSKMDPCGAP